MQKPKGFTLIESITGLSLFLVVVLLVGSIYILAQQTYNQTMNQNELIQNARVSLDRLSRELRQTDFLVTDTSATSTEIFFQNGHNSDYISYIRYYLNGTDLYRDHIAYYIPPGPPSDPAQYTYYSSTDPFGIPAMPSTIESRIVGEYFDSIQFYGENGLVTITANFEKANTNLNIDTKVYIRNY